MLKIREAQLSALQHVLDDAFQERVFRFARAELAECVAHLDDAALRERIREDHEAARRMGIADPARTFEFLGLSLMGGDRRFYLEPEAEEHLTGPGADPEEQVRLILLDVQRMAEERMR